MTDQDHIFLLVDKLGIGKVYDGVLLAVSGFVIVEVKLVDGDLFVETVPRPFPPG